MCACADELASVHACAYAYCIAHCTHIVHVFIDDWAARHEIDVTHIVHTRFVHVRLKCKGVSRRFIHNL